MNFHARKLVKPEDLNNPRGTLFDGRLLEWIDEEAAIYVEPTNFGRTILLKCT
jgi:acyl-CoA hydrolase